MEKWALTQKTPYNFSFEIFGLLQFNPDVQQRVLEMQSPIERLHFLLTVLNENY